MKHYQFIRSVISIVLLCAMALPLSAYAQRSTPVTVVNDGTNPVPVQDVDHPTFQHFAAMATPLIPPDINFATDSTSVTVPADRILVIEHVSLFSIPSFATPADAFLRVAIQATTAGQLIQHQIGVAMGVNTDVNVPDRGATFVLSQPVRIYADPGTVVVSARRNFTNTQNNFVQSAFISISGHHVGP